MNLIKHSCITSLTHTTKPGNIIQTSYLTFAWDQIKELKSAIQKDYFY